MPQNRLRELRVEQGLSLDQLAQRLDPPVAASTVHRWETSEHEIPRGRREQIAEVLSCSVSFLMGYEERA